jgi:hypothetical protein
MIMSEIFETRLDIKMNPHLAKIPKRIFDLATGSLAQANMHSVFADPQTMEWDTISVLNAAHAGELFIKAIIAREHPLLLFRDLFELGSNQNPEILDVETLILQGKTHDFSKLPQLLWATTGQRIPDLKLFKKIQEVRNSIQHFCAPDKTDFRKLSLEFIYKVIDPLVYKNFGICCINYHEDHNVGYDYIVQNLMKRQIRFSIPEGFEIGEFNIDDELKDCSASYRDWFYAEIEDHRI